MWLLKRVEMRDFFCCIWAGVVDLDGGSCRLRL